MTEQFPDISSYQAGLRIQSGTVAVVAKATQGVHYQDPDFHGFMDQAGAVNAIRSGYHFLEQGSGAAQADYCHQFAGDIPVMLDCEPGAGSRPTVGDCLDFIERYHALGGRVWAVYFPHWYWDEVGGDLRPLRDVGGACLISSSYSGYTDNSSGAGWQPYGGLIPTIWQWTNSQPYGGAMVDFNAFRGTAAQLAALINSPNPGDDVQLTDEVTMPPAAVAAFPDFGFNSQTVDVASLLAWTAARVSHIANHLPAAAPAIDVNALGAAVASHLTAGGEPTAEAIATALTAHLTLTVGSK